MENMTGAIIAAGRELAVLKNGDVNLTKNQGVLFGSDIDQDGYEVFEAWVISEFATVRWSDCGHLDFPKDVLLLMKGLKVCKYVSFYSL